MKLLIVTQVIDTEHPVLGFFHRWVEEFAKHCEQVHVICLQAGRHSLPANVTVHSLGKEAGKGRFTYLVRFCRLIWKLRREYDSVFVHMNQVYVILGGLFWRVWGKRIGLWYMHGSVPFSLRIAEKLTHQIFTGSPESFRLKSSKLTVTGHGIDTEHFKPLEVEKDLDVITVGRITESKNLKELVRLHKEIHSQTGATLTVVGGAVTQEEQVYEDELKNLVTELELENRVRFPGRIPQAELPAYLNRAKVFVTVAQNGSLDKAVLEAMACSLFVVSMAPGTESLKLSDFQVPDGKEFVLQTVDLLRGSKFINEGNASVVKSGHSITSLASKIVMLNV